MSATFRKCLSLHLKTFPKITSTFLSRSYTSGVENVLHSNLPDIEIPKVSLDEFILQGSERYLNLTAAECGVTGRKYTFEDIRIKSRNFNRALRKKLKLEKGNVLGVLLPNSPEFVLVATGALKAGLTVTTMNPIYTPDEISRQLADSSTKVIVTQIELFPLAKAAVDILKTNIPIITIRTQVGAATPNGAINFDEFVENIDYHDLPPAHYDDVAFLPYSSGTTGLPKGVKLSHRNIVANIVQFNHHSIGIMRHTTKEHQDVIPTVLPQFHIYGLVCNTLSLLHTGSKAVTLPKFTPDSYLNVLRKHKPDSLFVAPPLILFLTNHPTVKTEDLNSIRIVVSAAAPLGALDEERFMEKTQNKVKVCQGYGMTESSPVITSTRLNEGPNSKKSNGSIGKMLASTLGKIVDPNDATNTHLGPNKSGELIIKGPQVMKEYHNRPKETKETFTEDGWLKTGDIMYYDENGMLFVQDRIKELIKVKGFQVPPAELEEIIRDFPNVEDAAVIGINHEKHGEVPRAFVVAKKGTKINVTELDKFVSSKVAPYKKLTGGIEFIDSIPKNATGKILRRTLKLNYEQKK